MFLFMRLCMGLNSQPHGIQFQQKATILQTEPHSDPFQVNLALTSYKSFNSLVIVKLEHECQNIEWNSPLIAKIVQIILSPELRDESATCPDNQCNNGVVYHTCSYRYSPHHYNGHLLLLWQLVWFVIFMGSKLYASGGVMNDLNLERKNVNTGHLSLDSASAIFFPWHNLWNLFMAKSLSIYRVITLTVS